MKHKEAAFTLVELIASIAIVVVLSSLAIAQYSEVRKNAGASSIVADLKAAYGAAHIVINDVRPTMAPVCPGTSNNNWVYSARRTKEYPTYFEAESWDCTSMHLYNLQQGIDDLIPTIMAAPNKQFYVLIGLFTANDYIRVTTCDENFPEIQASYWENRALNTVIGPTIYTAGSFSTVDCT